MFEKNHPQQKTIEDDKVGVLLYGVKEKQNPNNFDGIRLLHDLDRPSVSWETFTRRGVVVVGGGKWYWNPVSHCCSSQ